MKNTQFTDDAPPLYHTVAGSVSSGVSSTSSGDPDQKRALASAFDSLVGAYAPVQTASNATGITGQEGSGWDLTAGVGGFWEMWRRKQKMEEMRGTLRGLIYDTLRNLSDPGAFDVLQSCQAACRAHSISFDELIQEDIEGHTPLYWAILALCHTPFAQPPHAGVGVGNDILELLLSVPLEARTIQDARAALMLNDANALFQTLRTYPTFEKTSYAESVIGLGSSSSAPSSPSGAIPGRVSTVLVEHVSDAGTGTFRVSWEVPMWCKRVKVARKVSTQWIARGRAWQCTVVIQSGAWVVSLRLLRDSASTPLDGVLRLGRRDREEKVVLSFHKQKLEGAGHACEAKLGSVQGGGSLEYEDSPFLSPEGTLYIQGEFVLQKKDTRNEDSTSETA